MNSVSYIMGQPLQDTIESGVVIGDVPMEQLLDSVEAHVANGCKRIQVKGESYRWLSRRLST